MKEIAVPGPPKTAFNKSRLMSDLIKKQVEHFKHLENKLPPEVRATLPQHAIVTEDDAARYIGPMTRYFLSQKTATGPAAIRAVPSSSEPVILDLAAAAEGKPELKGTKAAKKTSNTRRGSSK